MKISNVNVETFAGPCGTGTVSITTGWWKWKVTRHNVAVYTTNGGRIWRCYRDQMKVPLVHTAGVRYDLLQQ